MPRKPSPSSLEDLLQNAEWVRRLAIRIAGPVDGDDAAQEAFLAALRSPPRHGANLRGFFATLVRNALRLRGRGDARRLRREAAASEAAGARLAETAAAAAERADLQRRLVTLVLALDEPQRTLVLRHYFDGVDVPVLARDHACSPDAVRAHLRRARETLRRHLDAEPGTRRALAALAKFAAAAAAPALPAAALTFPVLLAMKTKSLLAATVAVAAAAVLWLAWPPADRPAAPHGPDVAANVAHAAPGAPAGTTAPAVPADAAERRDAAPAPTPVAASVPPLRVRLRGLHHDAPWTTPVQLVLRGGDATVPGTHAASGVPAADGTLELALPAWAAQARDSKLAAEDPSYLPIERSSEGPFAAGAEVVVDVQVVAVFTGRVVDADGEPVPAARVVAHGLENGLPGGTACGETNTAADGRFVLQAPPAVDLGVGAVPMRAAAADKDRAPGRHGALPDTGAVRSDRIGAWVRAHGGVGTPNRLGDVVLPRPAQLTGVVRWSDGPVMPEAYVNVYASSARTLLLGTGRGHYTMQVGADGWLASGFSVRTDAEGKFAAAAPGGVRIYLTAQPRSGAWNAVGGAPTRAVAPAHVEVVVPRPIALRAVRAGEPAPRATIRLESAPGHPSIGVQMNRTDERGEMWLQVGERHVVVQAVDGPHRSAPQRLGPDDVGKEFVLALDTTLAEITIEFAGEHPVRNTHLKWKQPDGTAAGGFERLQRGENDGPFRIYVEPGTWTLWAGPSDGERNGRFLLPVERTIEVPPSGLTVTLPASFGGQLVVHATDSAGVHVPGTCRLVDARGVERSPTFLVWTANRTWGTRGEPGELRTGGPNECDEILAASDYDVLLDFGALGSRRERVTLRPREITELRARL